MARTKVVDGIEFEVVPPHSRFIKSCIVDPVINRLCPKSLLLWVLRRCNSPIIQSSLRDPGGWDSMRLAYENPPPAGSIDRIVKKYGIYPMGLRNRKKLCVKTMVRLLQGFPGSINIISIGAGPGANVIEPMARLPNTQCRAFCIDLNKDAFVYGAELAKRSGVGDRVHYIQGNAVDVKTLVSVQPHIVTLVGIMEYLTDAQILDIMKAMREAMPVGGAIMMSTLVDTLKVDRFMTRAFNFHLHYRDAAHVTGLAREAGFTDFTKDSEPLGIYDIIVGYKRG
jgi:precorrin-6B methylase 2